MKIDPYYSDQGGAEEKEAKGRQAEPEVGNHRDRQQPGQQFDDRVLR